MKTFLNLFTLVLFSLTVCFAQSSLPHPPEPPQSPGTHTESTTTNSCKTRININMNGNQKLKLRSDDHGFDMDLNFKKVKTSDIRRLLTKYLGTPTNSFRSTEEWTGQNKSYRVRLKKGNLDVSFDKDELPSLELEKMMTFTKDVFETLGLEVNLDI